MQNHTEYFENHLNCFPDNQLLVLVISIELKSFPIKYLKSFKLVIAQNIPPRYNLFGR